MFEKYLEQAGKGYINALGKIKEKEEKIEAEGWKGRYKIMRKRSAQGWLMSAVGFFLTTLFGWKLGLNNKLLYISGIIFLCSVYLIYQDYARYKEAIA